MSRRAMSRQAMLPSSWPVRRRLKAVHPLVIVSGLGTPSAQVLLDLMNELTALMVTEVTIENQAARNAEIARLKDQMAGVQ